MGDGHQPLPAGIIPFIIPFNASMANPLIQFRRKGDGECRARPEALDRRLDGQLIDVHAVVTESPGIFLVKVPCTNVSKVGLIGLTRADLLEPVDELEVL
jgi:hypothetical protein